MRNKEKGNELVDEESKKVMGTGEWRPRVI
jgi:hypothetical protein